MDHIRQYFFADATFAGDQLTGRIIGAAIEVHKELGPGKSEAAYEAALLRELALKGIACRAQKPVPVVYKGIKLECGYRLDLLVEDKVVVEVKSVDAINPVHQAQVLTYLKLGGWRIALLLNFNVAVLKEGLRRLVMGLGKEFETGPERTQALPSMPTSLADSGSGDSERFVTKIIASAIDVHRELGPGLLTSAYEACLIHELVLRGIPFERGQPLALKYKGFSLLEFDQVKLLVGGNLLVITLAVTCIQPVHQAQLLSQLRLGGWKLGLLLNFNTIRLCDGIRRVVLS